MPDTHPPRCAAHGGAEKRIGAPLGNQNALKHGYYAPLKLPEDLPEDCSIDALIDMLYQRQLHLDDYIECRWDADISVAEVAHLLRLFGQNASRLGRLLRDRRALSGDAADGLAGAVSQALDELSTELGTDL
jgi:hypothetical protein